MTAGGFYHVKLCLLLYLLTVLYCPNQVAKGCKSKGAPQVETYSVDLTDLESLDKFAKSFLSSHKHCDVLVNNAGMMGQGSPTEGPPDCSTSNH